MTRSRAHAHLEAIVASLAQRLAAAEARERVLTERVDSLSRSNTKAWRTLERLDLPGVRLALPVPPMPLERVPIAVAAERLDVDDDTVRRWIAAGVLEGEALAIPGRRYRQWSVFRHSLDAVKAARSGAESAENLGRLEGLTR